MSQSCNRKKRKVNSAKAESSRWTSMIANYRTVCSGRLMSHLVQPIPISQTIIHMVQGGTILPERNAASGKNSISLRKVKCSNLIKKISWSERGNSYLSLKRQQKLLEFPIAVCSKREGCCCLIHSRQDFMKAVWLCNRKPTKIDKTN